MMVDELNQLMKETLMLLDNSQNNEIEKEQQLLLLTNRLMNSFFTCCITIKERQLRSYYQAKGYHPGKKQERTIYFLFGSLTYSRTPWKKGEETIYPIDKWLSVQPYVHYSIGVISALVRASQHGSFRDIAAVFSNCSPILCSKDTVGKLIHNFGELVGTLQKYEQEHKERQQREVPYLFIEADGFMLNTQQQKKKEVAHFVVHEGRQAINKIGQSRLKNDHEIISPTHSQATLRLTDYLYQNYKLKNTVVVINTDGGVGYEPMLMRKLLPEKPKRVEQFIDPYHVRLKLSERVFIPELYPFFKEALGDYSREKMTIALDTLHSCCENKEQEEHYTKLTAYINRNWKHLKPYRLRDLPKENGMIGIIESRHRAFTYRMKKQGRYWGKKGMNGMLQIIAATKNHTLDEVLLTKWREDLSMVDGLEG